MLDLSGQRFGRLIALERRKGAFGESYWRCRCECGNEDKWYRLTYLRRGVTKSCGCYQAEVRFTHGESRVGNRLYGRWQAFRARCRNPSDRRYKDYGGRGIYCVPEWDDFATFQAWAHENGYHPSLQIDRIDNDGPYAPWNCRWVTPHENMVNRRANRMVTVEGVTRSLVETARHYSINSRTLTGRLNRGQTPEQALGLETVHENDDGVDLPSAA